MDEDELALRLEMLARVRAAELEAMRAVDYANATVSQMHNPPRRQPAKPKPKPKRQLH